MAVNLIRAHREELMQASSGTLDHMVIDVVGSLFDQILSDPRVPPQMARQIARLQLPVLRVALNDSTFFSSRRHPVRRFVNRIASLACAFDDFDDGPGKQLPGTRARAGAGDRRRRLRPDRALHRQAGASSRRFIAEQTQARGASRTATAAHCSTSKESELRMQQRYMQQLQAALDAAGAAATTCATSCPQVWSQALVLAARRDGAGADRAQRFRRAGRDLVMSVQPKGTPALRKTFLMQLPQLMKDLNEGMALIGWPEAAQKDFFGQLLPAHAESLKAPPLSELDHNLLAKQLEGVVRHADARRGRRCRRPTRCRRSTPRCIERRFTPEEARAGRPGRGERGRLGGQVDIDLGAERRATPATEPTPATPAIGAARPGPGHRPRPVAPTRRSRRAARS